ncbi:MAG: NAD(P)H-dependent oxidoreductase [Alphaproteobacteria bacterium]
MNVLIVYAHPEPKSFNAALRDLAQSTLEAKGHRVRVSDLYGSAFEARVTRRDFLAAKDPAMLNIIGEQAHAWKTQGFAGDIKAEIDNLAWADFVILQFPIWWFGPPAVVKGWMDRVFVPGFTYGRGKWFETGGLAGKRAMLSVTVDASREAYSAQGRYGGLEVLLWPVNVSLRFVGFDVLRPFCAAKVSESEESRRRSLEAYAARLRGIDGEAPLAFHAASDFGEDDLLKPGIASMVPSMRTA